MIFAGGYAIVFVVGASLLSDWRNEHSFEEWVVNGLLSCVVVTVLIGLFVGLFVR